MRRIKSFFFLVIILFLIQSCINKTTEEEKQLALNTKRPCIRSFEIFPRIKDTVNVIDCNQKKQGHWIITKIVVLNKKYGPQIVWSEDGYYIDGKREGFWKTYDDRGNVKDSINYKNDKIVQL